MADSTAMQVALRHYPPRFVILFLLGAMFAVAVSYLQQQHRILRYSGDGQGFPFVAEPGWLAPFCGFAAMIVGTAYPWLDLLAKKWEEGGPGTVVAETRALDGQGPPNLENRGRLDLDKAFSVRATPQTVTRGTPNAAATNIHLSRRIAQTLKLRSGQSIRDRAGDWGTVMRCCGGVIGLNYAASKLPWTSPTQLSLLLALLAVAIWFLFDRTIQGFALSASMSTLGTIVAFGLASQGLVSFTHADFLSIRSTIPSIFFSACICFGSVGRNLSIVPSEWQ
ncbi:hypothetical protein M427DRAFT_401290 [Gonapodya prolifera JEL478]|uniref:Uncharacterized protein n=1 Tax=Gonapodya prolifera (strain JEL478) TaxID=1344416 RepID=A0A139ATK7_GONPJ|nr:hypothetical protein M427DRAFT_401290 [Gonapodya prolifera JEL478]|eukprot:KXS20067.1 hypothetical protein M427DRAFT_401290 [Gonapodya prolifera JEL478]